MIRRVLLALVMLLAAAMAPPLPAQEPGAAVTVRAAHQEWLEGTMVLYRGDVVIQYQDVTIRTDEIELDTQTMDLVARGNVVLDQGPRRFTADEIHYNLRTKVGVFLNAQGHMAPTYYFTGERIEKLDETHYVLEDATFTACEPEPRPPWAFHVNRARIEEEGYGHFYGTSLDVKGVPVFYLPYLMWPVKTERTTGLLTPSFGYSDRRGAYLGNALFLALARSWDATILLDAFEKGSVGVGSEVRWAPAENAFGTVELYTIYDHQTSDWEWRLDGRHEQDDFYGFRLLAEVEHLSDLDFFREFEHSFDRNTLRSLYSYAYLTRTEGPYSVNLRLDRRRTYFSDTEVELNQLPEVELRVRPTRIGRSPVYWSLVSSANLFDVDRGGDLKATYGRADALPRLSATLPGPPWFRVSPSVGARGTYYTARLSEDRRRYEDEGIDRSYLEGGVDVVGPSFSRVFNRPLGPWLRFKHLIEPRLEYSYVSDAGDTSLIPRFDEVDSTLVTNRVRASVANRLLGRRADGTSARELASFEVAQEYSFSEPLNRASSGLESQRGPLDATLRLTPTDGVYLDARAAYDTLFDGLRSTSLSASFMRKGQGANLTWYQGYRADTGERTSSQVRAAVGLGGGEFPLRVDLHVSYDVEQAEFQQQRLVTRYEGSCWGITAEYRDLQLGTYPNRDYRISIDFKGVGRLLEIQGGLDATGG